MEYLHNLNNYFYRIFISMIPLIDSILGRMPCPAHDGQVVQTYCRRKQCFKYLCSKCQMLHTQQHNLAGTTPDYQSIEVAISNCQKMIETQIKQTQKNKLQIKKQQEQWQKKKRKCYTQIDNIQQKTLDYVLKSFDRIRRSFSQEIQQFQLSTGIKSGQTFQQLYENYEETIKELKKCKTQLKKPNSCAQLKSIFNQVIPKTQNYVLEGTRIYSQCLNQKLSLWVNQENIQSTIDDHLFMNIKLSLNQRQGRSQVMGFSSVREPLRNSYIVNQPMRNSHLMNSFVGYPQNQLPNRNIRKVVCMSNDGNIKNKINRNSNSTIFVPQQPIPRIETSHPIPMKRSTIFKQPYTPQF